MKSTLKHEGWRESDELPKGWMLKDMKDRKPHYLGLGGEIFESISKAAEFVTKYEKYFSQEDLNKIQELYNNSVMNKKTALKVKSLDNYWIEGSDDNLCPKGWKMKNSKIRTRNISWFISPNGVTVKSRRLALQYMTSNKFPEKEIQIIRDGMKQMKIYRKIGFTKSSMLQSLETVSNIVVPRGNYFNQRGNCPIM